MVYKKYQLPSLQIYEEIPSVTTKIMANKNMKNHMEIGYIVKSALLEAAFESRIIVGLSECISALSKFPESTLFCILIEPKAGDSATHMHEVLLEAFCNENAIYVIKVDSSEKLSRILGISMKSSVSCVLIQRKFSSSSSESMAITSSADIRECNQNDVADDDQISDLENTMIDYCEEYWDAPIQPVIKLPDD